MLAEGGFDRWNHHWIMPEAVEHAFRQAGTTRPLLEFYGKVKAPPLICTPLGRHGALKLARKSSAWLWRP